MREDRPLDALLPELAGEVAPSRADEDAGPAFHPGVLVVEVDEGYEWSFACWRDPGGAEMLIEEMSWLLEAVLLAKMSEHAESGTADKPFTAVRLFVYDDIDGAADAMGRLGFTEVPSAPDVYDERLRTFQDQAAASGWDVGSRPHSIWYAPIVRPDPALSEPLEAIDRSMREAIGSGAWGDQPGMASKLLAEALQRQFTVGITPTLDGLDQMDVLLVDHTDRAIRWLPPMVFQGLADFIAVVAHATTDLEVQWGLSTTDESGWTSPPVIRVRIGQKSVEMPLGRRLVNWVVMPVESGGSSHLRDRFAEAFDFLAAT